MFHRRTKRFRTYILKRQRRKLSDVKQLRHHPFVVPVTTFLILFFVTIIAFIALNGSEVGANDTKIVRLNVDHKVQSLPTRAETVGELLKKLNITLHDGDVVEPSADTPIVEDNFRVNVYRARPVTIIDGTRKTVAFSAASTPRSTAAQAGITVYPEDIIDAAPVDNVLQEGVGEKVVINRATPINLNLYGTPIVVRTQAKTVGAMLKEKNVKLAKDDMVQPAPDTVLAANAQVFVTRNGVQIATVEEPIASPREIIEDASLSFGTQVVRQQGAPGRKLVTYQIEMKNGKEVNRHVIQEVTIQDPIKTIVARGKAVSIPTDKSVIMRGAGIPDSDYPYVNYIVSRESGWCATKWQGQHTCPSYYQELYPPTSGHGYGLCQSTPAIKMSSAGSDWQTNPITQMKWCNGYAHSRFGSWQAAYNYWQAHGNW